MPTNPNSEPKFYWNTTANNKLENVLLNVSGLTKFVACCAFLSPYGVDLLRKVAAHNSLTKDKVTIYLSRDFSQTKPGEILEELRKFARVKIFDPTYADGIFHAKLYVLYASSGPPRIIVGSSNLTKGGFKNNVEFNMMLDLDASVSPSVETGFLGMVEYKSVEVTDDIILQYMELETRLHELKTVRQEVEQDIAGIFQDTDTFKRDKYDLTGQYFVFEDYEAFFPRNQPHQLHRVPRREVVQRKLLDLAEIVLPNFRESGINLHLHWSSNHQTSLTFPAVYNRYRVAWLGVRLGKHQDEVMRLSEGAENDEFIGFQKHACLQFAVTGEGFETSLYHSVKNDAVDRPFLLEQLHKSEYRNKLVSALRGLQGRSCFWVVGGGKTFYFSKQNPEEFPRFYLDNDREGYNSYLMFFYKPDDERVSKANIKDTILADFKLFYPLYELVAKRY